MPYMVFGLPTHILLIHLAVVGIPTSCLCVIAIAARPKWRQRHGIKVAIFAVAMVPVTYATQLAGEQLFNHDTGVQELAQHHKDLGENMVWFMLAVAVLAVLLVLADKGGYADHHTAMVILASLSIAASIVCIYWVIQVGDSGARAVWGFMSSTG
jgi:cytochrome bd-type quinol oxidase subunit 2